MHDLKHTIMANKKKQSLVERLDEIKANSVTDEYFKRVWGKPIDECVEEDMKKWDELCKNNKRDI